MKYLIIAVLCFCTILAKAETFDIPNGDVAALIAAIEASNGNGEADIIRLAENGRYEFRERHSETRTNNGNVSQGWTGLPQIQSEDWPAEETLDLTIEGNGASFIRNSDTKFRFIYVHVTAKVIIKNLHFENGAGKHRGGAIFSGWRTSLEIENCSFTGNRTFGNQGTFDQGGGAVMIASESRLSIRNCTFSENSAEGFGTSLNGNGGGAVLCLLSDFVLEDCSFRNNSSANSGGAVYTDGALKNKGTFRIQRCSFTGNRSDGGAGALLNYIYNQNESLISDCHFEGNQCGDGHGGALYSGAGNITHSGYTNTGNQTRVNIRNCSFINNESRTRTGGLFINEHHSTIENCTFFGNKGGDLANAIFIAKKRLSCELKNLTVAGNGAGNDHKALFIAEQNPKVTLSNCIFSENNAGHLGWQADLALRLQGSNLQFPGEEFGTSVPTADPLLQNPAFNGANTKTMALREGSPAIDAGSGCTATDQRGASRVGNCDIGAYEFNPNVTALSEEINARLGLKLYPNPAAERVILESDFLISEIKIFSLSGKLLLQESINAKRASFEVGFLPKGVYFLKTGEGGVLKFVK